MKICGYVANDHFTFYLKAVEKKNKASLFLYQATEYRYCTVSSSKASCATGFCFNRGYPTPVFVLMSFSVLWSLADQITLLSLHKRCTA